MVFFYILCECFKGFIIVHIFFLFFCTFFFYLLHAFIHFVIYIIKMLNQNDNTHLPPNFSLYLSLSLVRSFSLSLSILFPISQSFSHLRQKITQQEEITASLRRRQRQRKRLPSSPSRWVVSESLLASCWESSYRSLCSAPFLMNTTTCFSASIPNLSATNKNSSNFSFRKSQLIRLQKYKTHEK